MLDAWREAYGLGNKADEINMGLVDHIMGTD
jgi:hypothetical protein